MRRPPTVVEDGQTQPARLEREPYPDRTRVRVLDHVGDGFLRHSKHHGFDIRIHRPGRSRDLVLQLEFGAPYTVLRGGSQRRWEVASRHGGRPQVPHGAAGVGQRLLRQAYEVAQGGNALGGPGDLAGNRE
jgi:hypothetical protein